MSQWDHQLALCREWDTYQARIRSALQASIGIAFVRRVWPTPLAIKQTC